MSAIPDRTPQVSAKLQGLTDELRRIQNLFTTQAEFDPRILTDFRDAVNRVRTTAWAMQQYVESHANERDPNAVTNILAGERIRAGYQLCNLIKTDLANDKIEFQKGQLLHLREAVQELLTSLDSVVREF